MQPSSGLVEAPRNIQTAGSKLEGALQGKDSVIMERRTSSIYHFHTRSRCQITIPTCSFERAYPVIRYSLIVFHSWKNSGFCLVTVLASGFNALLHAFARSANPHKAESGWVSNCHASTCFRTCFIASLDHHVTRQRCIWLGCGRSRFIPQGDPNDPESVKGVRNSTRIETFYILILW